MPIATPEVYAQMLDRAKEHGFAYPAINVTSSQMLNAALNGFADAHSDGIIQVSTGGAEYLSGQAVKEMVTGSVALAEFAHVVAAKYPVHIALHTDHCPKDKLDRFMRPLVKLSRERVARGEPPLFQSHMWDGSAVPPRVPVKLRDGSARARVLDGPVGLGDRAMARPQVIRPADHRVAADPDLELGGGQSVFAEDDPPDRLERGLSAVIAERHHVPCTPDSRPPRTVGNHGEQLRYAGLTGPQRRVRDHDPLPERARPSQVHNRPGHRGNEDPRLGDHVMRGERR
jgi:hypothetical protein